MRCRARLADWIVPISVLALVSVASGGELDPPVGAVTPTMKDLDDVSPRQIIRNDFDTLTPIVITSSGSYYLGEEIFAFPGQHGIEIQADDVTIDLNGFTVTGNTEVGSLDGIIVTGVAKNHVKIYNGRVEAFFGSGIDLSASSQSRVEGVSVFSAGGDGIRVGTDGLVRNCQVGLIQGDGIDADDGSLVSGCVVTEAGLNFGAGIRVAEGCTVVDGVVSDCGRDGISTGIGSEVRNCVATNNGTNGISMNFDSIAIGCQSDGNVTGFAAIAFVVFKDCFATNNSGDGFLVGGFGGARFEDCTAYSNGAGGIIAPSRSHLIDCSVESNQTVGVSLGSSCTLKDVVASNTVAGDGISSGGTLTATGCVANDNAGDGIVAGIESSIRDCTTDDNTGDGVVGGNDTLIKGCFARGNGLTGMHLTGERGLILDCHSSLNTTGFTTNGPNNTVTKNIANGNATNYVMDLFTHWSGSETFISGAEPWANFRFN